MQSPLLNVQEAAEYLRSSADHVRSLVHARELAHLRRPGKRSPIYFTREQLDAYLESITRGATARPGSVVSIPSALQGKHKARLKIPNTG